MRISDWSSDVCSSDLAPDDFVGTFNTDRFCNSVCKSGYLRHDGNDDGVPAFSIVNPTGSRTALPEPRGLSAARIGVDQPEVELSWPRKSRSEEHTSELQSLMRISYAVSCLKTKITMC